MSLQPAHWPRLDHQWRRFRRDPAIHFNIDIAAAGHLPNLGNLGKHRLDESLPAEARVHRHHQNQIEPVQDMGDGRCGCCRIERHAGAFAESPDGLQ